MQRVVRLIVASVLAVACAWPVAATAQTQGETAPTVGPLFVVDQVRSSFSSAGFQVDQAYDWSWTRPPVTSFQVRDQNTGRVLMVLVYPSATAAMAAQLEAETHEQALQGGQAVNGTAGPHLVVGYGPSLWNGNVALVETTQAQLERAYQAQADRDNGIYVDQSVVEDPGTPDIAVDLDFQQALQNGAVNL